MNLNQSNTPREQAWIVLKQIYTKEAYTDIALERVLSKTELERGQKNLVCELVYGIVRRQRTLDGIIDRLGQKTAQQQPPDLRIILHLGLYQLRYLDNILPGIAVSSSVDLAKKLGLGNLTKVVNGLLRAYLRQAQDFFPPPQTVTELGVYYSFPDWIIEHWQQQLSPAATEELCQWFNQPPKLDLRINPLKTNRAQVASALSNLGIEVETHPLLPQSLRLVNSVGSIRELPGYQQGWWTVQDNSAQLVTHFLNPQPGETIIDACAAPGGKTTHLAELMGDQGIIYACDRNANRLKKVKENAQRLQLTSIIPVVQDAQQGSFETLADRVLVDAPCSGLGTLHKRPDLRWRQNPAKILELVQLQQQILTKAATWVKPSGEIVYATCTLNPQENEQVIEEFLVHHPHWYLQPPEIESPLSSLASSSGWIKIWPHLEQMDGFFLVKLKQSSKENYEPSRSNQTIA